MNLKRLGLLVQLLTEVRDGCWHSSSALYPPTIFNLNNWVGDERVVKSKQGQCAKSACACGYAMVDSRFNSLGLTGAYGFPEYGNTSGWTAIYNFFELSKTQARWLFHSEGYGADDSINAVIERLQTTIAIEQNRWYRPIMDWVNTLFPKAD